MSRFTLSHAGSRGTLNGTLSGSKQTLNQTTFDKNTELGHLKCALVYINDNIEDSGIERKLKLEDLSRLTSDQMLKIVTFLLRSVIGEKHINQTATLPIFQDFGLGSFTYDCGIDQIYHAIKPIFPEDSDLFHFSVLLMPSIDPKRTKAVITYIFSFLLMCDNFKEQFAENYGQILAEIEEEKQLYGEVETLRNAITDKIQEKAVEASQVQVRKRELQKVLDAIGLAQVELAKWNERIEKLTGAFQHEQNKIQWLNEKLRNVQMELEDLKQYIVNDPNEIRVQNDVMRKEFQAESDRREALAEEIEKNGSEREAYEALNQRAKHAVHSLEAEVSRLGNIRKQINLQTKSVSDIAATKDNIASSKKKLNKLNLECEAKKADLHKRKEEQDREINELVEENNNTQEIIKITKRQIKSLNTACSDAVASIDKIAEQVDTTKEIIAKYMHWVEVKIPQLKQQHVAEAEEMSEKIKENFCYYPTKL